MKNVLIGCAMLACTLASAARPEPTIHWPNGYSPRDADLFDHSELAVDAPCRSVWQALVDVRRWPDWYPNSEKVVLARGRELMAGRSFQWRTFGLDVDSVVHEFGPQQRLGWFGRAQDLNAYHTWLLLPQGEGCRVVTEEVVRGPAALALRAERPEALHEGHSLWLSRLGDEAIRRLKAVRGRSEDR